MLIPQYSIRFLLGLTTACAVAFMFLGMAVRGNSWAFGVTAALGTLCLVMLLYAAMFALLWLASLVFRSQASRGDSPFGLAVPAPAEDAAPPGPLGQFAGRSAPEDVIDATVVD